MRISDWSSDVCSSDLSRCLPPSAASSPSEQAGLSVQQARATPADAFDATAAGCRLSPIAASISFAEAPGPPQGVVGEAVALAQGLQHAGEVAFQDRKSVVSGKGVSVRVDLGGRRIIKKKQ